MSENPDSVHLSLNIRIGGRAALVRNSLIGAVLGVAILTEMMTLAPGAQSLISTLSGGVVIAGFSALTAWFGQKAARQPINMNAIGYSMLIGGVFGVIGIGTYIAWQNSSLFVGFINTMIGLIFGAGAGAALTAAAAIIALLAQRQKSATSQAQMLGQGQFDPLGQMDHVDEQVYHRQ